MSTPTESPIESIKKLRESKKVTQKQMADKLGCNLKTYQRFENGKNKGRDMLGDVCSELGLVVLVADKNDMIQNEKGMFIIFKK